MSFLEMAKQYLFPGKTPDKPFYDMNRPFEKAVSAAKLDGVTFQNISSDTLARHTLQCRALI